MKMFWGIFLVIIGIAIITVSCILPTVLDPTGYTHTGKELFNETEFIEFKIALASDDVDNLELEVMNVSYPVLVQYSFTTSDDIKLANEDITPINQDGYSFLMLIAVPFLGIGAVSIIDYLEQRK
jgi:hypothetical protein